jgi:hypothetical protein
MDTKAALGELRDSIGEMHVIPPIAFGRAWRAPVSVKDVAHRRPGTVRALHETS